MSASLDGPTPGLIPLSEPVTGPIASTTAPASPGRGRHAATTDPGDGAGDRGRTEIADRVVERMAGRIAGEIDHVGGTAGRVLGVPTGREDADRAPRVDADVRGDSCSLRVRLSVTYPAPAARTAEAVREHLTHRLGELTGLEVRAVDIAVSALHRTDAGAGAGSGRRVQ